MSDTEYTKLEAAINRLTDAHAILVTTINDNYIKTQDFIHSIDKRVLVIETENRDVARCKFPSKCVDLEPRIVELEKAEQQRIGGWKLFIALPAIAAALAVIGVKIAGPK